LSQGFWKLLRGAGMYKGIKRSKQAMTGTPGTAEVQHLPERSKV